MPSFPLPSFSSLSPESFSRSSTLANWSRTAVATGNIMAVVAVLLIHMDRNHVGNMKPNINLQHDTSSSNHSNTNTFISHTTSIHIHFFTFAKCMWGNHSCSLENPKSTENQCVVKQELTRDTSVCTLAHIIVGKLDA